MSRRKIDITAISEEIEGLSIENLEKAYKRYRERTKRFQGKNVRDPLDHIDFEVNLTNELADIKYKLESGNYSPQRPQIHFSAKKNGIGRPTVSLQIEDAIVYLFCLEQLDQELIAKVRSDNIRGGILLTPLKFPDDGDYYEHFFKDWMDLINAVQLSMGDHSYIATTDIASYFDNVDLNVLQEMLRSSVNGKSNVLELLFHVLQGVKLRYGYYTTLKTGLVQDDSDGSRLLAYFYLYPHDNRMMEICKELNAEYFRFADDMNITVRSEIDGKRALGRLSDSLRQLGLTASIEKTYITGSDEALFQMLKSENDYLSEFEERLRIAINLGKDRRPLKKELNSYYNKLLEEKVVDRKNWIKVLKRFYTFGIFLEYDFLLNDIGDHLLNYPVLTTNQKLERYFIANHKSPNLGKAVEAIIDYLESPENLYPQTETDLLELLCALDFTAKGMTVSAEVRALDYARRVIIGHKSRPVKPQSDYAKGICVFLLYKLDRSTNNTIAQIYLKTEQSTNYYKKCLVMVGLTSSDAELRKRIKNTLRTEASTEMKRLNFMVANLSFLKNNYVIKNYKNRTKVTIYYDERKDASGKINKKRIETYNMPIRVKILREILKVETR